MSECPCHPMSECPCQRPVPLEWGSAPAGTWLYEVELELKIHGLTWKLNLVVRVLQVLSHKGIHDALYASPALSRARARKRECPVSMVIYPTCDGGSRISVGLGPRRPIDLRSSMPPLVYALQGNARLTSEYLKIARAGKPITRKVRKLLTAKDRQFLFCVIMCTVRLPAELREIILSYLNLSDA